MSYLTLCRPILEYAVEVWDPYMTGDIHSLEMVQHKAMRFILDIKGIASMTEARDKLNLDSLEDRRRMYRLKALHGYIAEADNNSLLYNDFSQLTACNSVVTRSASRSVPLAIYSQTNSYYHSFLPRTARDLRLA